MHAVLVVAPGPDVVVPLMQFWHLLKLPLFHVPAQQDKLNTGGGVQAGFFGYTGMCGTWHRQECTVCLPMPCQQWLPSGSHPPVVHSATAPPVVSPYPAATMQSSLVLPTPGPEVVMPKGH